MVLLRYFSDIQIFFRSAAELNLYISKKSQTNISESGVTTGQCDSGKYEFYYLINRG